MNSMLFFNSMNALREEFLLLAEKLKLDTRFVPLDIIGTPKCTPSFLDAHFTKTILHPRRAQGIFVGPYLASASLRPQALNSEPRTPNSELQALVGVYKKLFLSHRRIRFIGVDLDDCLYDVTPIRHLLVQKINTELYNPPNPPLIKGGDRGDYTAWALYNAYKDDLEAEDIRKQKALTVLKQYVIASEAKQSNTKEIVERTYLAYKDFSRLDDPNIRTLYKPYKGVKNTLRHLVDRGDFIVGILTNGPSKFQRDKIGLLGLKEGKHFNFIMVSEDTGIGKPSRRFFELAREKASQLRNAACEMRNNSSFRNPKSEIRNEECLILEDQVKNLSGANGWLKVQFLKGYHSNIPPTNIEEIPKYGITEFSILPDLINLEKDSDFQTMAASCFVLKSLLLLLSPENRH